MSEHAKVRALQSRIARLEAERLDLCRDVQIGRALTDEVTGRLYVATAALRGIHAAAFDDHPDAQDHEATLTAIGVSAAAALARIREESAEASATPLEIAVAGLVPAHALPPLVLAVQAVQATSADCATEGPLLDRVNRYCAAQQHAEAVLRATFSTRELERLTGLLVDMHTDPLADDGQTLDSFVSEL